MVANSLLEIYTIIFGWTLYDAIWDVLVGTGAALVPFVAAVVSSMKEGYEKGDTKSAMRNMETSVIGMVIVLVLCVIPWSGFGMEVSTVKYDVSIPDCNMASYGAEATEGAGDDTGTSYDTMFPELGGIPAYRPVAWSLVELFSTAVVHSTIESIQCVNNYNYMLMRIGAVTFEDMEEGEASGLRQRVTDFYQTCYQKSLATQNAATVALPGGLETHEEVIWDTDWIGSRLFLQTLNAFYRDNDNYLSDMERYGFNRQPVYRESDAAAEHGAHPYCWEVWLGEGGPGVADAAPGLRQLLLEAIPEDAAGSIRDAWNEWGYQMFTMGAIDLAAREDLLLKIMLQADAGNLNEALSVDLSGNMDVQNDWFSQLKDWVGNVGIIAGSTGEILQGFATTQILKNTGPLIVSMVQFILVIAAPFVMVLAGFQFKIFVALGMTYFGFEFINAIWAFAFWFDQKLLDLYWSSTGGVINNPENVIIWFVLTVTTQVFLPFVWLTIYGYAATGMVRNMGIGGTGGGAVMGGANVSRAASGAGRAMGKGARVGGGAVMNKVRGSQGR